MIGNSIKLAPLCVDDELKLFDWINDREQVLYNSPYKPVHFDQHKAWFESVQMRNDLVFFTIKITKNDQLIGTCQLHSINNVSRAAELQIRLCNVEERGKGLGTQAVRLLLDFGFKDLNLNRIYLHVFEDNHPAIRVYEKVGFMREGLLRKAAYIDGAYVNIIIMGLLKDEYIAS